MGETYTASPSEFITLLIFPPVFNEETGMREGGTTQNDCEEQINSHVDSISNVETVTSRQLW